MKKWKRIIKSSDRYKDFIMLESPMAFNKVFSFQDISLVQLHSIQVCGKKNEYIVGFCGCFKWEDNKVTSLDGDSYSEDEMIYGFSWFTYNGDRCLDILVD